MKTYTIEFGRTTLIELAQVEVEAEDENEAREMAKLKLEDPDELEKLDWDQTDISKGAEIHIADVQPAW